ncbi:hypothetical protein ACFX1S_047186 [Malus domestica]
MEPYFGVAWKKIDIFDAIKLLTIESSMDIELLMAAISFWCSATNTMVLPLGPMGATVLDVTAIIGTSPNDIPISTALSGYQFDLDLKMVFEECVYEILKKKGDKVLKDEVSKLHKKILQLQHAYQPLRWLRQRCTQERGARGLLVLLVEQVYLLYQIKQVPCREYAGYRGPG